MSNAVDELKDKVRAYRASVDKLGQARLEREEAKRSLRDLEVKLYYEGITNGSIDGKNSEAREAQAQIRYRENPQWGATASLAKALEERYQKATDEVNVSLTELRVAAIIVNVEIAEAGAKALLAEINLGSI